MKATCNYVTLVVYAIVFAALLSAAGPVFASFTLVEVSKNDSARLSAIGLTIRAKTDGKKGCVINADMPKTDHLRRGMLYVAIQTQDGEITSTWCVEPGKPLSCEFTVPQSLIAKCHFSFSESRADHAELELYSTVYAFDLASFVGGEKAAEKKQ